MSNRNQGGTKDRNLGRTGASREMRKIICRPIAWLLFHLKVRFLHTRIFNRIGHVALEPTCFVIENVLGLRERCLGIVYFPLEECGNPALLRYWRRAWKRGLIVLTHPFWKWFLKYFLNDERLRFDLDRYSIAINENAQYYAILKAWRDRRQDTVLWHRASEERRGRETMRKMGVPDDAWWVCFHCRSPGFSPVDDDEFMFRNSEVETYFPAVQAIVEAGGWAIRMGDPTMPPLPAMERVIDYAHSEHRSPFMDIFIAGSCRFFIGNTSGIILVPVAFGIPTVWTNIAPMSAYATPGGIGIPKLVRSIKENRVLRFDEVMGSQISHFRYTHDFTEKDLECVDNAPDEIRDLTLEMLARVNGNDFESTAEDDELQEKMHALLRPGHYSYGTDGRVGRDFLRKHRDLLE